MTISNTAESLSERDLQPAHFMQHRPNFEAALARISERKAESSAEYKIETASTDSFGSWYEWD